MSDRVPTLDVPGTAKAIMRQPIQKSLRSFTAGFTLMEILAVLAIIALLAAFFYPVLQKAQVQALYPKTHASMRSLHQSFQAYAADHRGWGPPKSAKKGGSGNEQNWVQLMDSEGYIEWGGAPGKDINPLVWELAYEARKPGTASGRTCAANVNLFRKTPGVQDDTGRPWMTFELPARMAAFMNAPWNSGAGTWGSLTVGSNGANLNCDFSDPPWPIPEPKDARYEEATMPVIFVDGHIEHVARKDFPLDFNENPFWTGLADSTP